MQRSPYHVTAMKAPERATKAKARYIMIGGFLGAGKTTAIGRLAKRLTDEGRRVGLITNHTGLTRDGLAVTIQAVPGESPRPLS